MSQPSINIIKSYVSHGDKHFFVSTIERDSSAVEGPRRYNETIVWEYDYAKRERGEMLLQTGDPAGSLREHFRVCEAYHETGDGPEET